MTDIGSIVIPIVAILTLVGGITLCVAFYFRFERHRTDVLGTEMAKNRKVAEQAVRQQEQVHARIDELTERIAAVEQILRSVG
ncbi:hypothetical protein AB0M54_17325 [Actinoplanes sp. NPDC051470]|uniref:hypothetical protein n=1 Tax=unclassified Actinoplanes TaxID=2626549 RepID=UPI00341FADFC